MPTLATGDAVPPPPSTKREPSTRRPETPGGVEPERPTFTAARACDPEADTQDAPPTAAPAGPAPQDAVAARHAGRQARCEGKTAADNPYVGLAANAEAAREWVRGLLDETERRS
jgi:hypothetical protein